MSPRGTFKFCYRMPTSGQSAASGVTIGTFDGLHRGHKAIIQDLLAKCQANNLQSTVLTFWPRPAEFFAGKAAPPSLMGRREKVSMLLQMGVEKIICLPFDATISELSADEFVGRIVVQGLGAKLLMIGDDFRFGNDRAGNYELLARLSSHYHYDLFRNPTVEHEGQRISSSRVREELEAGHLSQANDLLGHAYFIQGRVKPGRQLGRVLDAPTANIELPERRLVMTGVFVVKVTLENGDKIFGVANMGFRPAVEKNRSNPILEVHLLDFNENLYGHRICVSFLHRLRDEQFFASHQQLKHQIAKDIEQTRSWLKSNNNLTN